MQELTIAFLRDYTSNSEKCHLDSWSGKNIESPFKITPKNFLSYADYDLTNEYPHHLVNSLSNIKRAIDCQFDSLLYGFGLFEKSKKLNWNFPEKINYLNRIGIISPRILRKINQKRNLLEHEYILPNKNDVEDALDVATLFIAYTERYLWNATTEIELYHDTKEEQLKIKLDYKNNMIIINETTRPRDKKINANSEEYVDYLRWYIDLYKFI